MWGYILPLTHAQISRLFDQSRKQRNRSGTVIIATASEIVISHASSPMATIGHLRYRTFGPLPAHTAYCQAFGMLLSTANNGQERRTPPPIPCLWAHRSRSSANDRICRALPVSVWINKLLEGDYGLGPATPLCTFSTLSPKGRLMTMRRSSNGLYLDHSRTRSK
jgi:hypothetical protein